MPIGDYIASGLRTFVSWLYGLAIAWLLDTWTDIPTEVADWLGSDAAYAAVAGIVAAAWYGLWRWLEPELPAWVRRITLGSAKSPTSYTRRDLDLAAWRSRCAR